MLVAVVGGFFFGMFSPAAGYGLQLIFFPSDSRRARRFIQRKVCLPSKACSVFGAACARLSRASLACAAHIVGSAYGAHSLHGIAALPFRLKSLALARVTCRQIARGHLHAGHVILQAAPKPKGGHRGVDFLIHRPASALLATMWRIHAAMPRMAFSWLSSRDFSAARNAPPVILLRTKRCQAQNAGFPMRHPAIRLSVSTMPSTAETVSIALARTCATSSRVSTPSASA